MVDGFIPGIFGCGSVRKALSLADRCLFAHRDETRHIRIFHPSSMRLAFFEIEVTINLLGERWPYTLKLTW